MLDILISLLTLTLLEIVLGIDNLVFIAILSSRLPPHQQKLARRLGLLCALGTRLILLALAIKLVGLTRPLFSIANLAFSGRDLFFLIGGVFLLIKSTQEIHYLAEDKSKKRKMPSKSHFFIVIFQIGLLDVIFSLDSILTAVGLTQQFWIMALAILFAISTMIWASEPLSQFIEQYPSVKILALSFLLLIGTTLIASGLNYEIPRGYIYFSVCFSLLVESLNIFIARKKRTRTKTF